MNLNLPVTMKNLKGGDKSFKILSQKDLNKKSTQKGGSILSFIKNALSETKETSEKDKSQNNKLNFIKASNTKSYYKNLKK